MEQELNQIKNDVINELNTCSNAQDYDNLYLKYFSKTHGVITKIMKSMPSLSIEEKKVIGPLINTLQTDVKNLIESHKNNYLNVLENNPLIDLSYPEPPADSGFLHPITQMIREMNDFFRYYGFSVAVGPEIETSEYNFDKLNLPPGHPATDLQDTLFIKEPDILLRTHTSSIESRVLSGYKPPIRAVVPGKVFRNETASTTNLSFFHQYQGFVVDKDVTIQHLKGIISELHKFLFGKDVVLRFRYKYYPEVSPGMGTDMQCSFCGGNGCAVCKQRGWIEVLGSGMVHYNTLKMCGIDPEVYTGFAFGMGLDRLVMQKFGINDIRKLYGGGIVYM